MLKSDIFLSSSFKQLMIEIKHGRGVGAREWMMWNGLLLGQQPVMVCGSVEIRVNMIVLLCFLIHTVVGL
jgi:hypothetical protein